MGAEHIKTEIDEQRERGSVCTILVFVLLPLVQLTVFIIFSSRNHVDADDVVILGDDRQISTEVEDELFLRYRLYFFEESFELFSLFIFNGLYWRYMLMFFPQLKSTSDMVAQLARPLAYALLALITVFLALSSFTFAVYSTKYFGWHAAVPTLLRAVAIAQGNAPRYELFQTNPQAFTILVFAIFVFVTLVLNNLALAIMVSYSKETDLNKSQQYHKQWQNQSWQIKKQGGADNGKDTSFNPARAGSRFWVETDGTKEKSKLKKKDVST